jgi:hypothetical protein
VASIAETPERTARLTLTVHNVGRLGFQPQDIYYHIYVSNPQKLTHETINQKLVPKELTIKGHSFLYFTDLLDRPVFPGRRTELFSLKRRTIDLANLEIYYYLSTSHGIYPRRFREDDQGFPQLNSLGRATVHKATRHPTSPR